MTPLQAKALEDHIQLMHPAKAPPKKTRKEKLVWKTLSEEVNLRRPHFMPGQLVNAHMIRKFYNDSVLYIMGQVVVCKLRPCRSLVVSVVSVTQSFSRVFGVRKCLFAVIAII